MIFYDFLLLFIATFFAILSAICISRWLYLDGEQRGIDSLPWVLISLLTFGCPLALIVYLFFRKKLSMETCPHCNAKISSTALFCSNCGARTNFSETTLNNGNNKHFSWLIAGIVVYFVAIFFVIWWFFHIAPYYGGIYEIFD
jgi:hypothetical protein